VDVAIDEAGHDNPAAAINDIGGIASDLFFGDFAYPLTFDQELITLARLVERRIEQPQILQEERHSLRHLDSPGPCKRKAVI
jgi:hypothetical protein